VKGIDPVKGRYYTCNTLRYFNPYNVKEDADKMLEEWDDVCNELGIKHLLIYGTCLGFYRDGGYIKHDNDIDVAVICSPSEHEAMTSALLELGFYGRVHSGTNKVEDKSYFKHEVMLGINYIPNSLPWALEHWAREEFFAFSSFDTIAYNGREYNVIHPVETYLEWMYGDWRTPELRPA